MSDSSPAVQQLGGDLTGLQVWPLALRLCRLLHRHPQLVRARNVLELGSGTGVVGLLAASVGARCVLTDASDAALLLCKHNLQLNGLQHSVKVAQLCWGDDDTPLAQASPSAFDVIVGSDCIYKISALDALFDSVALLLSHAAALPSSPLDPPLFLLSYQPRCLDTTRHLLTVAHRYGFDVHLVDEDDKGAGETQATGPSEDAAPLRLYGVAVRLLQHGEELVAMQDSSLLMCVRRRE